MDVYVVFDGQVFVGVSAKLQGAENRRSEWAGKLAGQEFNVAQMPAEWTRFYNEVYDRQQIVNTELQDAE